MSIELVIDSVRIEFRKELTLKHLPEELSRSKFYKFDIEGYLVFPLGKAIHLLEEGSSAPAASIEVTEQTNYLLGGRIHTKGEYSVRVCPKQG